VLRVVKEVGGWFDGEVGREESLCSPVSRLLLTKSVLCSSVRSRFRLMLGD
jgi:hypothetical protein